MGQAALGMSFVPEVEQKSAGYSPCEKLPAKKGEAMRLIVVENTYPKHPGIDRANQGDAVRWEAGRKSFLLVRIVDGRTVFSRDRLPRGADDDRPMVGVIAQVKSKGWRLVLRKEEEKP